MCSRRKPSRRGSRRGTDGGVPHAERGRGRDLEAEHGSASAGVKAVDPECTGHGNDPRQEFTHFRGSLWHEPIFGLGPTSFGRVIKKTEDKLAVAGRAAVRRLDRKETRSGIQRAAAPWSGPFLTGHL